MVKEPDGHRKVWICLLTCLVIRAVHLEVVQDMSISQLMAAFQRFCASRGTPEKILSDNATQFKLADFMLSLHSN